MTFEKVELPDDEEIIRLFARPPKDLRKPIRIRASDFDRVQNTMSGISMFRAAVKDIAREKWSTRWAKGVLIAEAGAVKALGVDFYYTGNDHFSVRCPGCDLSQNQLNQKPLCNKPSGICDFSPAQIAIMQPELIVPLGIRDRLAQIFRIDVIPY